MYFISSSSRFMGSSNVTKLSCRLHVLARLLPAPLMTKTDTLWNYQKPSPPSSALVSGSGMPGKTDNLFIDALVKASTCGHHVQGFKSQNTASVSTLQLHHHIRRKHLVPSADHNRSFHGSSPAPRRSLTVTKPLGREDYLNMVDYYRGPYHTHAFTEAKVDGAVEMLGLPEAESIEQGPEPKDHSEEPHGSGSVELRIEVEAAILMIRDQSTSHEDLYDIYRRLPCPGVTHLPKDVRQVLLQRLSVMEKINERKALWYLTVVDDMKAAGLPLSRSEWSSAIRLAGRCFATISDLEVENALRIWKEMELGAGVKSTTITFNILFDIAVKAGKFGLAEMIMKEMKARDLKVNRFTHTGLIYYHGVRGDGNGIRDAYRELVESGEIVNTVVLNSVIAALLRAGELPAAQLVYERMKIMYARDSGEKIPEPDWAESRELARVLDRAARCMKTKPHMRQQLQDDQSLAPDSHTYVVFLEHHVSQTGELHQVASLFDDMYSLGLPLHGKLFLELFRGFAIHGGVRYTSWSSARLESVWASFLYVLDQQNANTYVGKWIAIWTLNAFAKCCGPDRILDKWSELRSYWEPNLQELEIISGHLNKLLANSE